MMQYIITMRIVQPILQHRIQEFLKFKSYHRCGIIDFSKKRVSKCYKSASVACRGQFSQSNG